MINGLGKTGGNWTTPVRPDAAAPVALPKSGQADAVDAAAKVQQHSPSSPAALLSSAWVEVDSEKIARVRAAIAAGEYPVDPKKIAEKMIELDLPSRD
jgi:negative regulator of flagellin synthesis FlgM